MIYTVHVFTNTTIGEGKAAAVAGNNMGLHSRIVVWWQLDLSCIAII